MYCRELELKNFRNYSSKSFSFIDGNNIIIGSNGSGKTNLLEAIFMLAMTKSFRRRVLDIDLLMRGSESYFIDGLYRDGGGLDNTVSIGFYKGKKQIKYNGNVVKRFSDIIGNIKAVSFLQEDISLILGSPSVRRKYLDMLLSLSYPVYFSELCKYNRIVRQKNNVLKKLAQGILDSSVLSVWNDQLIGSGSIILGMRYSLFESMNGLIKDLYSSLGFDIGVIELSYRSSVGIGSSFKDLLSDCISRNGERELLYKQSLYGPHKDDFLISVGGVDFSRFASQGQSRACALVLKLAMTYYIEEIVKQKSILLLDDVLLDLDERKKESFFTLLGGRQNFFTSTSLYGFSSIEGGAKVFDLCS